VKNYKSNRDKKKSAVMVGQEYVVLVDEQDNEIGIAEKLEAHEKGLLHRAFSVFIFNEKGELLLQQRADHKYHSPNLWTNTCCSHPRQGEAVKDAAVRRLKEEMGLSLELEKKFDFIYKAEFDNNLTEHEFDHVFVGNTDQNPILNTEEAKSFKWKSISEIKHDMVLFPYSFTAWFKIAILRF
jgi:isopentenyl-diphosphate Delta-isomerase